MKNRWMALALIVCLLMGGLQVAVAEVGIVTFMPWVMRFNFNSRLEQLFEAQGAADSAARAKQYSLNQEETQGGVIYVRSDGGEVTLTAYYASAQPDSTQPADTLNLILSSAIPGEDLAVLEAAFAGVIAEGDATVELETVQGWMDDAAGGMLSLNGYVLVHRHGEDGETFTMMQTGGGDTIVTDGGDTIITDGGDTIITDGNDVIVDEPAPAPAGVEGAIVSRDGVTLVVTSYRITRFEQDDVSLRLYTRVINDTDARVRVAASASVDGVGVHSTGLSTVDPRSDSGEEPTDYFLITQDDDNAVASVDAILNAREVSLMLSVEGNGDTLFTESVTVSLADLPGEFKDLWDGSAPSSSSSSSSTSSPGGGSTDNSGQAQSTYRALVKGDTGEDVRRLQQRLIELGYLYDTADGKFGPKTAAAVREFSEANGLGSSEIATAEMQERLYSSYATAYVEDWVPLEFLDGARGEWRNASNRSLGFRAKATNTSRSRTIKAFEMTIYCTDVWGDKIYGSTVYVGTTTKRIKPGESAFSEYFVLPQRDRISTIWAGISKVIFTDGTIRENYNISFTSWSYKG